MIFKKPDGKRKKFRRTITQKMEWKKSRIVAPPLEAGDVVRLNETKIGATAIIKAEVKEAMKPMEGGKTALISLVDKKTKSAHVKLEGKDEVKCIVPLRFLVGGQTFGGAGGGKF